MTCSSSRLLTCQTQRRNQWHSGDSTNWSTRPERWRRSWSESMSLRGVDQRVWWPPVLRTRFSSQVKNSCVSRQNMHVGHLVFPICCCVQTPAHPCTQMCRRGLRMTQWTLWPWLWRSSSATTGILTVWPPHLPPAAWTPAAATESTRSSANVRGAPFTRTRA